MGKGQGVPAVWKGFSGKMVLRLSPEELIGISKEKGQKKRGRAVFQEEGNKYVALSRNFYSLLN